jgi:hypothetical protein
MRGSTTTTANTTTAASASSFATGSATLAGPAGCAAGFTYAGCAVAVAFAAALPAGRGTRPKRRMFEDATTDACAGVGEHRIDDGVVFAGVTDGSEPPGELYPTAHRPVGFALRVFGATERQRSAPAERASTAMHADATAAQYA